MAETGRNDPCPCGSGKKYKKCCALKTPMQRRTTSVVSTSQSSKMNSLFKSNVTSTKMNNLFQTNVTSNAKDKDAVKKITPDSLLGKISKDNRNSSKSVESNSDSDV